MLPAGWSTTITPCWHAIPSAKPQTVANQRAGSAAYALLQAQRLTPAGIPAQAWALRRGFAADHDHSYRQQQQLKLEWQTVLDSTLAHGNGWFLRCEGSW